MPVSIKQTSSSRFGYSEDEMADAFQKALQSPEGLPDVGVFDAIYREVSCRQGRPDFIALRYGSCVDQHEHLNVPGLVGPSILNKLKLKAPRTFEYLVESMEFTRDSIRKSLRQLIEKGYVEQTESGAYRLALGHYECKPEIWSFELKLNNPKKAVFQAQQSRAFAERAIIVVPPGQEKNYERFRQSMSRWQIGLATFDLAIGAFRFVRKGRKAQALSRTYQLYALAQMQAHGKVI